MDVAPRFLRLSEVEEILNISHSQATALVHRGDLPAIRVGGRGQWRVERTELEAYIQRNYDETRRYLAGTPALEAAEDEATTR